MKARRWLFRFFILSCIARSSFLFSATVNSQAAGAPTIYYAYARVLSPTSCEFIGGIRTNGESAHFWFRYWTAYHTDDRLTQSTVVANSDSIVEVRAIVTSMMSDSIYQFHVSAENSFGRVIGVNQNVCLCDSIVTPRAITMDADSITMTKAILRAKVNPNMSPATVKFYLSLDGYSVIGWSTSLSLSPDSNEHDITIRVTDLTPGVTYYYGVLVDVDEHPGNSSDGEQASFTTLVDPLARGLIVPLRIQDTMFFTDVHRYFGVHTYATPCIDPALGELTLPPRPPSGSESRFIGRCLELGLYTDLRKYVSPAQIDTYKLSLQDPNFPLVVSWPHLASLYSGPVTMKAATQTIDMQAADSCIIDDPDVSVLIILAQGPQPIVNQPNAIADAIGSLSPDSVVLSGLVIPNSLQTFGWFEWGISEVHNHFTPPETVAANTISKEIQFLLTGLQPHGVYHYRIATRNAAGYYYGPDITFTTSGSTSVDGRDELPKDFILYQNYPNPFNPTTEIHYQIGKRSYVSLKIYDVLGNMVAVLVDGSQTAGDHRVNWDARHLSAGVYFYRLEVGTSLADVKKMIILK